MNYEIVVADLVKDREAIRRICSENLSEMPEERFCWKYENNPDGKARCLLIGETGQQAFVGTTALFPRHFLVGGTPCLAAVAGDFAIDKRHRSVGPALSVQRRAVSSSRSSGFDFLYGFPNKMSEAVMKRAGYTVVGDCLWLTKPVRSKGFLKASGKTVPCASALSKAMDFLLRAVSYESRHRLPEDFSFERTTLFDSRVDRLWEQASRRHAIIGVRSSGYLNWKFISNPRHSFDAFELVDRTSGEVAGYIVSTWKENRVKIVDMLYRNERSVFHALMSAFVKQHVQAGCEAISMIILDNRELVALLRKYGFFVTNRDSRMLCSAPAESALDKLLRNRSNWYIVEGDEDI